MQASIEEKMRTVIERGLKGGKADLETLPNGHVTGHVISDEFVGLDYEARRNRIRDLLERELGHDERIKVSTLLTYTPEEWSMATSGLN